MATTTQKLIEQVVHDAGVKAFRKCFAAQIAAGTIQVNVRPTTATRYGRRRNFGDLTPDGREPLPKIDTPAIVYSVVGGYWPEMLESPVELVRTVQVDSISRQTGQLNTQSTVGAYEETVLLDRQMLEELRKTGRLINIDDLLDEYEPGDIGLYRRIRTVSMSGDN